MVIAPQRHPPHPKANYKQTFTSILEYMCYSTEGDMRRKAKLVVRQGRKATGLEGIPER